MPQARDAVTSERRRYTHSLWSDVLTRLLLLPSLSFGAGGKNRDTGVVEKGWGYYEVSLWSGKTPWNNRPTHYQPNRPLQAEVEQAQIGTERPEHSQCT